MIVCVPVPTALGVYETEQEALDPLPESVQLVGLKVPLPLLVKETVPVGVVGVAVVSVTVAVQVVGCPTATAVGVQLTPVEVDRSAVTMIVVEPSLPLWSASPP